MDLQSVFYEHYQAAPHLLAQAPGRVNLLGEHVDYNQGVVLPAAIDRRVSIAASPLPGELVRLRALDLEQEVVFRLDNLDSKQAADGTPLPGWALYPAGVAWMLQRRGLAVSGMQAAYTSDIPIGAGLSSSAAVEVGFAAAWQALGGWQLERLEMAQICQQAENQYAGVACGLMDQFASACGVEGHALYFDTRDLHWLPLPLLPGSVIVIADSGLRRSLAHSAYNQRRAACEQAVELLRGALPDIQSLRDLTPPVFAAYKHLLPEDVRPRAEHVVREIARVDSAVSALRRSDARSFGALMFAGHASLRDLFEVSLPELDALVEIAHGLPGCIGARLTGAGFGGCTVNLVEAQHVDRFMGDLSSAYWEKYQRVARVYACRASQGAGVSWL